MGDFTIDIEVGAPSSDVFDYLADGTRTPEWYEAVIGAVKTTEGSTKLGTGYMFTRRLPQGQVVNEVEITEFEQPTLITFTSRSGPTPFVYRYRVETTATGARVTLSGTITGEGLRGPAALLAPVAGRFFEKGMAKNLAALKARLEN